MGVRRAVELSCNAVEHSEGAVYTLGPLIHNPQVLDDLSRRGIKTIGEAQFPALDPSSTLIIRAHGIGAHAEAELRRRGAVIIDATCPHVKASQLKAAAYAQAGYRLFLAGEAEHAEIIGIKDYYLSNLPSHRSTDAEGNKKNEENDVLIVSNAAEAEQAAAKLRAGVTPHLPTALIAQTTISAEEYDAITGAITRYFPNLEITRTICTATRERQESLRELLDKVDAIIVAGGKDSANTRRLFAIAEASLKPCALVESTADIPPDFFNYGTIGICAGASTPDSVIDAINNYFTGN